ncbi:MAG: ribosome silencing factor [Candidatus Hydrothermia bacterium]
MGKRVIISPLKEPRELAREIAIALADKKATDVMVMDLTEVAPFIADFFVLATALTRDHARSLADTTEETLIKNERTPHHTEGYSKARWILVDADEVVIHIMTRDAREFYAIESLWGDARIERYGNEG